MFVLKGSCWDSQTPQNDARTVLLSANLQRGLIAEDIMHTANWTWRGGAGACMKPSQPSSRFFGAERSSAGYLKRNLKTNPAPKHLIPICPAGRRGACFFRPKESTTGTTFCSLVHFWSGKCHIQAISSAVIFILDMKYENGQIPWSCSLLRPTTSKHALFVLHATCELHEDLHSSSHVLSLMVFFILYASQIMLQTQGIYLFL